MDKPTVLHLHVYNTNQIYIWIRLCWKVVTWNKNTIFLPPCCSIQMRGGFVPSVENDWLPLLRVDFQPWDTRVVVSLKSFVISCLLAISWSHHCQKIAGQHYICPVLVEYWPGLAYSSHNLYGQWLVTLTRLLAAHQHQEVSILTMYCMDDDDLWPHSHDTLISTSTVQCQWSLMFSWDFSSSTVSITQS